MPFNHTGRSIHSKGDMVESGTGQLLLLVPLLIDCVERPEGRLGAGIETAAVELRVWQGDRT